MKTLVRFLVGLAMPFVLVFGGAGLIGLGLDGQVDFLVWAGLIVFAVGLLWCLGLYLWIDAGTFRD